MLLRQIFDNKLAQYAYLVGCLECGEALLVDPERDIDRYVRIANEEGLTITAVAETHIHADFLSGARAFAEQHDTRVYLSDEGDENWKYAWPSKGKYDVELLSHGDIFTIGNVELKALHTPGHTPEHLSFLVTDRGGQTDEPRGMITGDFVFVGDVGRPDLLEAAGGKKGSTEESTRHLYHSMQRFSEMPDYLQIWPGHGAGSACGKALGSVPDTTVGYERRTSPAMEAASNGEDAFVNYILSGQPEQPPYFTRMKLLNKEGPPLLRDLPSPASLSTADLDKLAGRTDITVIDTRSDWSAFMRGHLPDALYIPFNNLFPTVAGSYIEPDQPIYLIVDTDEVDAVVRNLIRVGLDRVEGYAVPELLETYHRNGGRKQTIEEIDFEEVEARRREEDILVLDVRSGEEYTSGHLPGAKNIAYTQLLDHIPNVPADKQLLVHCHSGKRSAVASAVLQRLERNVAYVNDHIETWLTRK